MCLRILKAEILATQTTIFQREELAWGGFNATHCALVPLSSFSQLSWWDQKPSALILKQEGPLHWATLFRELCTSCALSPSECPTLCDPMDCSPSGCSVHGILQTRILEWVAILSSMLLQTNKYVEGCLLGADNQEPGCPPFQWTPFKLRKINLLNIFCSMRSKEKHTDKYHQSL